MPLCEKYKTKTAGLGNSALQKSKECHICSIEYVVHNSQINRSDTLTSSCGTRRHFVACEAVTAAEGETPLYFLFLSSSHPDSPDRTVRGRL